MPGKYTYTSILLAGLTATSLVTLAAPEITADISPQARQYLERAKSGDVAAMDMSDPARMAKLRKALGAMFLKSALKIDPDLYLTEQEMNDVSGYWVNSSKPEKTGRVILLSDSVRLARQARNHSVDVELDVWDGMWHVWQDTPGVPEAEQACRELAGFFTRNLK